MTTPAPRSKNPKPTVERAAPRTTRRRTSSRLPATAAERKRTIRDAQKSTQSRVAAITTKALRAAASILNDENETTNAAPNSVTRTWQHAVIGYARSVPELSASKMYVGNCCARVKLKTGKRNADGSVEAAFDGSQPVEGLTQDLIDASDAAIATIRSEIGGQSELLRSYGEKMFLVGENFLVARDGPSGVTYDVLSTQELAQDGGRYIIRNGPGMADERLDDNVKPIRIWHPDDQYRKLATSSVRACMEILEELVILTRLVRSAAISRMALAGILLVAEELDDLGVDQGEDGQTAEETSPLIVDMILQGSKAIDDPASAAAWFPYVLTVPSEMLKEHAAVEAVEFKNDSAGQLVQRREALERLAQGLDLPMEVVLGHQSTTFANAAQISEDTFKLHIEPTLQMFCDAVTVAVLWPALAIGLGVTPEQVGERGYPPEVLSVAVTYDASELVSRPDRTKDIVEAYAKDISQTMIRNMEVREALGLDPNAQPDNEEVAKRVDAIRLTKIRETIQAPAGDAAVPVDEFGNAVVPGQSAGQDLIGQQAKQAQDAAGQVAAAALGINLALAARVSGAADVTLERIAERVGAKVKDRMRGTKQWTSVETISNAQVTRTVGPSTVRKLLGDDDPAGTEIAAFERAVARWAEDLGHGAPGALAHTFGSLLDARVSERLFTAAIPDMTAEFTAALLVGAGTE